LVTNSDHIIDILVPRGAVSLLKVVDHILKTYGEISR